jgi:phenylalanyl-tRNA synthetase beta subunit
MDARVEIRPAEHASYIPGRVADIFSPDGRRVGAMGEVYPEVLENYGLKHPVSVMELSLEKLLQM